MLADDSIQSMGGKARAEALTAEQRTEIAKKAADARWSLPRATHRGMLNIPNIGVEIECHNLVDGTRLLSRIGVLKAIGRTGKAKGGRAFDDEFKLPVFLTAKNLKPFITSDLIENSMPVMFIPQEGGSPIIGYKAELLPKICEVFLKLRDDGDVLENQKHIVKQSDILMRGLAHVGIIALVDEATGYQRDRAKEALAQILEKFIAKELQPWTKTFPVEFYQHIFRLQKWPFDPKSVKRPSVIGHYTNNIVYKRLAPNVLDELRKKNPIIDGRRKHKLFQWLTGEIGHPKLKSHIDGVLALMRVSDSWEGFIKLVRKAYPIVETTELGIQVELMEK
jgi:P63C domain